MNNNYIRTLNEYKNVGSIEDFKSYQTFVKKHISNNLLDIEIRENKGYNTKTIVLAIDCDMSNFILQRIMNSFLIILKDLTEFQELKYNPNILIERR